MHYGEKFNSITHFVGAIMAAIGAIILITLACRLGDPWKIVSFTVYGGTLLALYVCSTLYHGTRGPWKAILQKFDHCAIYLLIAGSYTPFTLVTLRGVWGWWLFGAVWLLALIGVVQELWFSNGSRKLSLVIYVLMGWLALLAMAPLIAALGRNGFAWLAAGGLFYTIGIIFYVTDSKLRHGHGIWHLFVLGGSTCHFLTILLYVA